MSTKKIENKLRKFKKKAENDQMGGILLFDPNNEQFIRISYGTGDNLLNKDISNGYDDYLYITIDIYDDGWEENIDGAQLMLKMKEDWNNHWNICQHVIEALNYIYDVIPEDIIPLQFFQH